MFSKTILSEIRDRISIVNFIGERIPLKRSGRNFKGLCPFHNEKTPSFNVNDDKQFYHCFGCGEGGDIFKFVMNFDGLGFGEAVRYLAGVAGVELPRDETPEERKDEEAKERKKRYCLRINEIAKDYFSNALWDPQKGAPVRSYLQGREIKGDFFKQLSGGFADSSWDGLTFHLKEKEVPLELACELGLIKRRDGGGYFDFFRNRLIFPIVSYRGEVLGFGGRALDSDGEKIAKYINSPDSLIYHKSNSVYGLDVAVPSIRSEDSVILVEGYMDRIALHQEGIVNVIAPLGTALTRGQVRLVSRYTRNIYLVFDGDEAGTRAALRTLELFIETELMPRVVLLPEGEDPDSVVRREGVDSFRARIDKAISLFEFFIDWTAKQTGLDSAGKVQAVARIVPMLKSLRDPVEQGVYSRLVANRLGVDESDVSKACKRSSRGAAEIRPVSKTDVPDKVASTAERALVEAMLVHPEVISTVFESIGSHAFNDEWCRTVVAMFHDAWKRDADFQIGEFIENIEDEDLASQIRAETLGAMEMDDEDVYDLVHDCVKRIQSRPKLERLEAINDDIRHAEIEGDDERLFDLLNEKRELALEKHT